MTPQKGLLRLNPVDNVAVVTAADGPVPRGHKVALARIPRGSAVLKFGHAIGVATKDIEPGEHVHVHNVGMPGAVELGGGELPKASTDHDVPRTFMGYPRAHGRAGVRNYVVVAASVNCSATVVKAVCRRFEGRADLPVDGVVPVTHSMGCAQAIGGEGFRVLNRTLAGWVFHPNVVGAVVIGLGCEGTTWDTIMKTREELKYDGDVVLEHFGIQDTGGTEAAIEEGVKAVERVLAKLPRFERRELPVSELNLALNCGGSDAFSSLTANPALGLCSDLLVARGGTVALAEIPECHGAEDLLDRRAADDGVRAKLRETFAWWQDHAQRHRVSLNNNLAPGNIAGGITTILEKSLGAVTKAGTSALTEVVDYAAPIEKRGFVLMNTPGFDPVSVTGLVAGGCNMVAFTTGRGSVYGCSIAPTIKIATRSDLFQRMKGDMDVDAGVALENPAGLPLVAEQIFRFAVDVASGKKTRSETLRLGWEEFAPWPLGETL